MKQAAFEVRYLDEIERFEKWLDLGRRKWRRMDTEDATALHTGDVPAAYRHLCQLMALARDRQYSPDLVDRLNHLVLRGHHVLYGPAGGQRAKLFAFLAGGFPAVVRAERSLVLTAALLFFGPQRCSSIRTSYCISSRRCNWPSTRKCTMRATPASGNVTRMTTS
jgi:hypothetical protein